MEGAIRDQIPFPLSTPKSPSLSLGGDAEDPNPKGEKHKPCLGPKRPRLPVQSPKPRLPAGPQDSRWSEGRRWQQGRCRGKLLISYGTLSSHSCERELGIFQPVQTQEAGLGRGDMVVSSLVSLLCCFCWCEIHPIPAWYHLWATPSALKATGGCRHRSFPLGFLLKNGGKKEIPNVEQVTDSKAGEHVEKVYGEKESVLGGRGLLRYRPRD